MSKPQNNQDEIYFNMLSKVEEKKRAVKSFTPIGDFVAFRPRKVKPAGQILVVGDDNNLYQNALATAIAVGPLCKQIKEGDLCIFRKGTLADNLWHDSMNYVLIKEGDVCGIIIDPNFAGIED